MTMSIVVVTAWLPASRVLPSERVFPLEFSHPHSLEALRPSSRPLYSMDCIWSYPPNATRVSEFYACGVRNVRSDSPLHSRCEMVDGSSRAIGETRHVSSTSSRSLAFSVQTRLAWKTREVTGDGTVSLIEATAPVVLDISRAVIVACYPAVVRL